MVPVVTASLNRVAAAARDATTGRPAAFLMWVSVFALLVHFLCPTKKPRYGKQAAGFAGAGLLAWLWENVVAPVERAANQLYDMLAKGPAEAIEKLLNALKPYLPRFLQPLIDWVLSMLRRFKDALMSPVVKSAVLAILGVWLILRMFRR